jgi:pantoate--beta-alanine ligase
LQTLRERIRAGDSDYAALEQQAASELDAAGFVTEYVVVRRCNDLGVPAAADDKIILAAARLGATRLIDNLRV